MLVLITGAATKLGAAVATALAQAGHTLRAIDAAPLPPSAPAALAAEYHRGHLTEPEFVGPLLHGVQAIVHLAPLALADAIPADAPGEVLDAAARGTHVLLKAALEANVRMAVQASTLAVMDAYDEQYEVTEQWRPRPRPVPAELAPYLAELTAREFTRDVQLAASVDIVCLRFDRLVDEPGRPGGEDGRAVSLADAAGAVVRALAVLQEGQRQRGHRWQLYHIAPLAPHARYSSAAARQALGYG